MTVRASRQPSTSLKPNFPDPTGSPTETLRGLHPFAPLPLQGFLRAPTSWTSATLTRPPTWSGGLGWRTGFASLILVLVGASATLAPDSSQCLINTHNNRIGRTHNTGGKYVIPPPICLTSATPVASNLRSHIGHSGALLPKKILASHSRLHVALQPRFFCSASALPLSLSLRQSWP